MKTFRGRRIDWTFRFLSCSQEKWNFSKISEFRRTKSILRPRKHLMEPYEKLGFCRSSSLFGAKRELKNFALLFSRSLVTALSIRIMIKIYINQNQYQQCLYFQYRSDTEIVTGDGDRWRPDEIGDRWDRWRWPVKTGETDDDGRWRSVTVAGGDRWDRWRLPVKTGGTGDGWPSPLHPYFRM